MASGRFADYLGKGLIASRPVTPALLSSMMGLWYSTDTLEWSAWNGVAWLEDIMAGGAFTGGSLSSALNEAKGADVASATTTNIGAVAGNFLHITGTTTITGLGTVQAGTERVVVFDGILTLTHNATSLILPTGANITTAAGDAAIFRSEGAGNWRCVAYQRADGTPLAGGGGGGTYTGTAGSIALTGSAFSIDATYVGQASITTLGTIATGTWNATAIGANKGGTGLTSYATGDLIYASATNTLSKLAAGTNGHVLTLAAGIPTWAAASGGGGGGLTNWTEAANSSAPNATVPVVSFTAANAATNVDVAITPKGSGAFTLQTADGTTAGGNKRGLRAIDLQLSRAGVSQVASGSSSVAIGTNNTASGNVCTAIGSSCQATAANTTAIGISAWATAAGAAAFGNGSVASGVDATAVGGATADGGNSYGMGGAAATRGVVGMRSEGTSTDRPNNRLTLQGSTNSTTPVVLKSDAATVSATNQFRMSTFNNRTQLVSGRVLARLSGSGGAAAAWSFEAMMDRDGGTISLIGTVTPVLLYSKGTITGWSVAITVSGTFNCLTVTATGPSGATVNWAAELNSLETPG